jgi:hypothetical protein
MTAHIPDVHVPPVSMLLAQTAVVPQRQQGQLLQRWLFGRWLRCG